jgi:hypothetical protein
VSKPDQPFSALAARRERRAFGSSPPVLLLASAPPPIELDPAVLPDVDPPLMPELELAPLRAPAPPAPGAVVPGFAAPISPADVPGPARPALSASAGEPCAAYAPATAADMHPATNATMSFLIAYLPKWLNAAT